MSQLGFLILRNALPACPRLETPFRVWLKPLILRFSANRWTRRLSIRAAKKGGRPPYDPALMFKILILQALYSLCDDQMPMTRCQ